MSTTIDNKVVKMTFDNKSFEKGVDDTLKTIDKLNKKLEFKNASEGFDNITDAANHVDFKKIEQNIQTLSDRFSGLGIIGMTIWTKIGDAAWNMITGPFRKVESAISSTIGAIESKIVQGGWNRALNLDQAENMIKALGYAWDSAGGETAKVYDSLKKQWKETANIYTYVDKAVKGTAYSLDEAAVAAGNLLPTLTSLGGDTGQQVTDTLRAIMGVSSTFGKSFDQVSYYFQKVATAKALTNDVYSTMKQVGIEVDSTLNEYLGLSGENLEKALKNGLISFEMFRDAFLERFGDSLDKANDTYKGAVANMNSAFGRLGAKIQIPLVDYLILCSNAVRLFVNEVNEILTPAIDGTVKSLTKLGLDFLGLFAVIQKGEDGVTRVVGLTSRGEKLASAVAKTFDTLRVFGIALFNVLKLVGDAFSNVFGSKSGGYVKFMNNIQKALWSFIRTIRKNHDYIVGAISAVLNVIKIVLTIVKTLLSVLFKVAKVVVNLAASIVKLAVSLVNTIAKSKAFKTVLTTIENAINKFINIVQKLIKKLVDFIKSLDLSSKATEASKKTWNVLSQAFKIIWDALSKVFDGLVESLKKFNDKYKPTEKILEALKTGFGHIKDAVKGAKDKIEDFVGKNFKTKGVEELEEKFETFGTKTMLAFSNPKQAVQDLKTKLEELSTYVGTGFSSVSETLTEKVGLFKKTLDAFTSGFGEAEKSMEDFAESDGLENTEKKMDALDRIANTFEKFGKGVELIWNTFKAIGKAIVQGFYWAFEQLQDVLDLHDFGDFIRLMKDLVVIMGGISLSKSAYEIGEFFGAITGKMKEGAGSKIDALLEIPDAILKIAAAMLVMSVAVAALGALKKDSIKQAEEFLTFLAAMAASIKAAFTFVDRFKKDEKQVLGIVKDEKGLKIDKNFAIQIVDSMVGKFGTAAELVAAGKLIESIGKSILEISGAIALVTVAVQDISGNVNNEAFRKAMEVLIASAIILGVGIKTLIGYLQVIATSFSSKEAVSAMRVGTNIGNLIGASALILSFASSISALAVVAAAIGHGKMEDLGAGLFVIATIAGVLVGVLIALSKLATTQKGKLVKGNAFAGMAATIVGLAVAIAIVTGCMYAMQKLDPVGAGGAILAILSLAAILSGAVWLMQQANKNTKTSGFMTIIAMAILLAVAVHEVQNLANIIGGDKGADKVIYSLVVIAGILAMTAVLALVAKKMDNALQAAAMFGSLAGLLISAAGSIALLHSSGANEIGAIVPLLLLVAGLAAIMGVFTKVLGKMGGDKVFATIGAGFLAVGAGVFLLAAAVKMLLPLIKDVYDQRDAIRQQLTAVADIIAEVLVGFLVSFVSSLADQAINLVNALGRLLLNILVGVVNFLVNNSVTIGEAIGHFLSALVVIVITALTVFFLDLVAAVKAFWGIASPSKKMKKFAGFLIDGLVAGIKAGISFVAKIVNKLFDVLVSWFPGLEPVIETARNVFNSFASFLKKLWEAIGKLLKFEIGFVIDYIKNFISNLKDFVGSIKEFGENLVKLIKDPLDAENWKDFGSSIMGLFKDGLDLMLTPLTTAANSIVEAVMGPIRSARDELNDFAGESGNEFLNKLANDPMLKNYTSSLSKAIEAIRKFEKANITDKKTTRKKVWVDIYGNEVSAQDSRAHHTIEKTFVSAGYNPIKEAQELLKTTSADAIMRTGTDKQKEALKKYYEYLKLIKDVDSAYDFLGKNANIMLENYMKDMDSEQQKWLRSWLAKMGVGNTQSKTAFVAGKYLGEEMIEGLIVSLSMTSHLDHTTQLLIDGLKNKLESAKGFAIASPSKYMKRIGNYLMEGLEIGIDDNSDKPISILGDVVSEIKDIGADAVITPVFDLTEIQNEAETAATVMTDMKTNLPQEVDLLNNTNASKIDNLGESVDGLSNSMSTATLERIITDQNGIIMSLADKLNSMGVYIDGKTLVGSVISEVDKSLGYRVGQVGRGVIG